MLTKKREDIACFDRLFNPHSIAVIGTSDNPMRGASGFFHALLSNKFPNIYPVSPFFTNIMGLPCYSNVCDIPHEIDFAIIGVPRKLVPETIEDCIKKGIKFAHIFTAGFSETGSASGIELEKKIVDIAKDKIRILGPNCMGIYCPASKIRWMATHKPIIGDIGFISQSGGHAGHFIELTNENKIGVSKVISVGNSIDLNLTELLEYLLLDPETGIIGLYIEGFKNNDGKKFFNVIKNINSHKPIVVWKAGKTSFGAGAVSSHTASIAGSYNLFKSACIQLGIQIVSSTEEMVDLIHSLKNMPLPRGPRVGILGIGGGQGVSITDNLASLGLEVPPLDEDTQKKITDITTESGTMVKNPVDPGAATIKPDNIKAILNLMIDDKNIDAILFHQNVSMINAWQKRGAQIKVDQVEKALINTFYEVMKGSKKPIFCAFTRRSNQLEVFEQLSFMRDIASRKNIQIYPSIEEAGKVIYGLVQRYQILNRSYGP